MDLLLLVVILSYASGCHAAVVKVEQGSLQGEQALGAAGTSYYAFRGVPFAQPPLNELRFKAPREMPPWSGVRDASKEGSVCTQLTLTGQKIGSEDCLFLNVYTPTLTCSSRLPVLVYFHASEYFFGDGGSAWYGPDYITYNNVVLVTANYRLGPFGFMNLGTAGAPGNAGLKDTRAVLRWVQSNIASFCGDPKRVTVGGISSGSMMSHMHTLSAGSVGLFERALLMSGNVLTSVTHSDSILEAAQELATLLGAKDNTTATLENTLKTASADAINSAHLTMLMREAHPNLIFKFTVSTEQPSASEGDLPGSTFITRDLESMLRSPEVKTIVPILTGSTSHEGIALYSEAIVSAAINNDEPALLSRLRTRFLEVLRQLFLKVPVQTAKALGVASGYGSPDQQQQILKMVQDQYFGGSANFTREEYIQVIGDMIFVSPLRSFFRLCRGTIYVYEFDVFSSYNFGAKLLPFPFATAASHVDDIGYLFHPNNPSLNQVYNGTGLASQVLRYVSTYFTNFVKGTVVGQPVQCGSASQPYLHINGASPVTANNYGSGAAFWDRVFDLRRSK